jgi:hypothetical protein
MHWLTNKRPDRSCSTCIAKTAGMREIEEKVRFGRDFLLFFAAADVYLFMFQRVIR